MAKKTDIQPSGPIDVSALALPWHDPAWRQLGAQIEAGRQPHALLVTGLPGLGKRAFALRVAQRLLCEDPRGADACGECRGCVRFAAGTHPDFHLVEPPEDKKQIPVARVRELIDEIQMTAHQAGRKVTVITPAEAMNRSTANALLKTLEEPSGDAVLVLVSSSPARLPATIRSRCQRVALTPPDRADALAWLQAHRVGNPERLLALAGGAPLAAQALEASALLDARGKLIRGLGELVAGRGDVTAAAAAWAALPLASAIGWLQTVVHDLVRLRQLGPTAEIVNDDLRRDLQSVAQGLDWQSLHRHLDELGRFRALADAPLVAPLQWEGVMVAWAERLEAAPLNR